MSGALNLTPQPQHCRWEKQVMAARCRKADLLLRELLPELPHDSTLPPETPSTSASSGAATPGPPTPLTAGQPTSATTHGLLAPLTARQPTTVAPPDLTTPLTARTGARSGGATTDPSQPPSARGQIAAATPDPPMPPTAGRQTAAAPTELPTPPAARRPTEATAPDAPAPAAAGRPTASLAGVGQACSGVVEPEQEEDDDDRDGLRRAGSKDSKGSAGSLDSRAGSKESTASESRGRKEERRRREAAEARRNAFELILRSVVTGDETGLLVSDFTFRELGKLSAAGQSRSSGKEATEALPALGRSSRLDARRSTKDSIGSSAGTPRGDRRPSRALSKESVEHGQQGDRRLARRETVALSRDVVEHGRHADRRLARTVTPSKESCEPSLRPRSAVDAVSHLVHDLLRPDNSKAFPDYTKSELLVEVRELMRSRAATDLQTTEEKVRMALYVVGPRHGITFEELSAQVVFWHQSTPLLQQPRFRKALEDASWLGDSVMRKVGRLFKEATFDTAGQLTTRQWRRFLSMIEADHALPPLIRWTGQAHSGMSQRSLHSTLFKIAEELQMHPRSIFGALARRAGER